MVVVVLFFFFQSSCLTYVGNWMLLILSAMDSREISNTKDVETYFEDALKGCSSDVLPYQCVYICHSCA